MMTATKRMIRTVGCLLALATLGCESRKADSEDATIEPGSVTVYPIVLAGHPSTEVTRFVAVLIERGGLDAGKIEVGSEAFASDAPFDQQSRGFGAFAARQSIRTDYALYCEYLGSTRGVNEVRSVLVDAGGRVVWSDRQRPGDREFDRIKPHDPETCTKLLMKRLRRPLGLADPFRRDAPKGTLAERFQREDGIPGKRERAAMAKRLAKLRDAAPNAAVVVYPVRIDGEFSRKGAETLAGLLNKDKLLSARVAVKELRFEFTRSMNQQKVLWSGARSIQELGGIANQKTA